MAYIRQHPDLVAKVEHGEKAGDEMAWDKAVRPAARPAHSGATAVVPPAHIRVAVEEEGTHPIRSFMHVNGLGASVCTPFMDMSVCSKPRTDCTQMDKTRSIHLR